MFISSAALVMYVLLFEHVSARLFLQLHLSGMLLFGHVSACLFLQLNLSGMCCFLDMFRHVYFFSCTCQVCASLWTCFGMFISSAALVRYVFLFRHVLACLFRQSNLPGMFAFDTCFARLFLLSNLPGMLCQPNMCVLFWTITGLDDTFAIVCLRIDDIIVYNALFATLTAQ